MKIIKNKTRRVKTLVLDAPCILRQNGGKPGSVTLGGRGSDTQKSEPLPDGVEDSTHVISLLHEGLISVYDAPQSKPKSPPDTTPAPGADDKKLKDVPVKKGSSSTRRS